MDILDELRNEADSIYRHPDIDGLIDRAANEIERLRKHCRLQAEDIMTLGQEVGRLSQQQGNI